ncbi:gliding motility-associated ABC transporter ATP-binding subunit GldA [Salibacteraceae bacterium]|nr:gliding motility-associated ABC transporter ATP-binding subunit GldA [Crocinitomicaceae bacterium]MDB0057993.1 gliding motility-associated ABC transporter ATP-binding subunit GldA [Salibacteraceae bacterium]MDC1204339.1 gliding motility-associated ABC transporter ATP-binding subunit GldA [Salibacteraceae bacterium]
MSIEVKEVSKIYGSQKALDTVSFSIQKGEIVGFLGPNGAGKSTMMKIITCFLPQSSGSVKVCGFDVSEDPMEVKKRVGYLPEHNPLYLDMYVKEYLGFIAGLHKIEGKKERVAEIIEQVGLQVEQHKLIGALSKGYRQRVGLAQALIHDPEVLILDEPTTGLDPNQIEEIRNLIKKVGKSKTVMMSTHIMQEVEAVCDRVIIVNKGNLVADDSSGEISKSKNNEFVLKVEFGSAVTEQQLTAIQGVVKAHNVSGNNWVLGASEDIRDAVFKFSVKQDLSVLEIQKVEQSLEDVFKSLTV